MANTRATLAETDRLDHMIQLLTEIRDGCRAPSRAICNLIDEVALGCVVCCFRGSGDQAVKRFFLAGLLCVFSVSSLAATKIIVGDQLTGANGVNVNGSLYNVRFADGTCVAIFDGCDSVSD